MTLHNPEILFADFYNISLMNMDKNFFSMDLLHKPYTEFIRNKILRLDDGSTRSTMTVSAKLCIGCNNMQPYAMQYIFVIKNIVICRLRRYLCECIV